jgi:hypothetical protein
LEQNRTSDFLPACRQHAYAEQSELPIRQIPEEVEGFVEDSKSSAIDNTAARFNWDAFNEVSVQTEAVDCVAAADPKGEVSVNGNSRRTSVKWHR